MHRPFIFQLLILSVLASRCFASEIDSVTPRRVALEDSRSQINAIFEQRIKEGVEKANQQRISIQVVGDLELPVVGDYCDEDDLYRELRKAIFDSRSASWGLKGYDLDKQLRDLLRRQSYSLSLNDSIYRDIDYLEGFSLNLKELSDVVRIEGNLIGLDKLGHYFAEGFHYFVMTTLADKPVYDALAWGKEKESGLFGYTTTGIFSFADLVANFNGMRFWNKVLHKRDDPLKGFIGNLFDGPYVTCDIQILDSITAWKVVKAWEVNTTFDIADYVDGSWDEGNNCNSYADPIIEDKVQTRIHNVDPDFVCPLDPEACSNAREKYGVFAKYLLHPACLTAE